jgi:hypothetical protein
MRNRRRRKRRNEPAVDLGRVHGVFGSGGVFGAVESHKAEAAGASGVLSEGGSGELYSTWQDEAKRIL